MQPKDLFLALGGQFEKVLVDPFELIQFRLSHPFDFAAPAVETFSVLRRRSAHENDKEERGGELEPPPTAARVCWIETHRRSQFACPAPAGTRSTRRSSTN